MSTNQLSTKIESAIDELKPQFHQDKGDITFKKFDPKTGIIEVILSGACVGCPATTMHLQEGVLKTLQREFREVKHIALAPETFISRG